MIGTDGWKRERQTDRQTDRQKERKREVESVLAT